MKTSEKMMKMIFFVSAIISIVAVIIICLFLFINGGSAILKIGLKDVILGERWKPLNNIFGILPMIIGSIYVTLGAIIIGVPIGILCAIYLKFYTSKTTYRILKICVDLMASIPSIIYGFFGLMVIVPIMSNLGFGSGKNILTASILLGIMILPTIISITENSLNQVRKSYYEGALALGDTKDLAIIRIVVPSAKSGIVAGVILGIGRAIGEAMAVVLVAGNQAVMPVGLLSGVRTLTANVVLEMGYAQDTHREMLIGTSLVLFVFILIINLLFSLIREKKDV